MALSGISIKVATYFAYLCACFKIYIYQYFKELLSFGLLFIRSLCKCCYYYYGTNIKQMKVPCKKKVIYFKKNINFYSILIKNAIFV